MKSLGPITCGLLSAVAGSGAASAGAETLRVVCPDEAPGAFCAALSASIEASPGGAQAVLMQDPPAAGPSIAFVLTRNEPHLFKGYLVWRTAAGAEGRGPELELTSMDAAINPQMLETYARQLVALSDLSPVTSLPE